MPRIMTLGILLSFGLVLFVPEVRAGGPPKAPKLDYRATHLDTSTGRYYVVMDSGIMADEDSLAARLKGIAKARLLDMWNGKAIKIALFSDPVYAYPIERLKKADRKLWADHYLADYDSEKNEVRIYPKLPARRKFLQAGALDG